MGMTSVLAHHDKTVFPGSREFLPKRWIGHPYVHRYLLSFSAGTRLCFGNLGLTWHMRNFILGLRRCLKGLGV
jgi:cytochrome P450